MNQLTAAFSLKFPSRGLRALWLGCSLWCVAAAAQADAVGHLGDFAREAKSGRADFTQVVTSPDGKKSKTSSGTFEFSRPNRFNFSYAKPFEQAIVADGQKVWIYDKDLNQASSRKMAQALGATPAALLAGGQLEQDFELQAQPDRAGLSWVKAVPRIKEGQFESILIGFQGKDLQVIEIVDGFGQRSNLKFSQLKTNVEIDPSKFRFTPPAGVDVLEQ